ncbi:MAG: AAA family ATPase [Candidatus Omnitrophota bacterium]|nr:AAA family ATPase [Candidatus Omnitrophota bacterium]
MYETFYGLREKPFNVTSDPAFFFLSKRHKEAFSHLIYGINERKGILLITGEIGTGKTTLCKTLLDKLDKKIKTAFILNPNFSETQLLQLIVEDLGIIPKNKTKMSLISSLNKFLLQETSQGGNVALIIDEAQNLKANQLEQIRLLSNLETDKEKLLQIILVGQPELNQKLVLTQLRQLNQRIAIRYHILPLEKDELKEYIAYRLNVAGSNGTIEFTPEALEEIFIFSCGIPRLTNVVCDRALLSGFVKETKKISYEIIKKCVEEIR